ncbi:hypothetical protein [Bradyrhizobium phage ppBeUSDA76-2]|uniref:hypothetical protein n=1 Tax=Bradyrhizobium elkanii TaxID=29448 RepID=UPI000360B35F|nr:hypothetical protein [Bradyrhizobium elkanii]WAX24441.1 hypothetical protein [Bradyrhizobium phage ppBeUSDA76-2]MCP1732397.1 hypothetical protein [Bradyrhizobium elkanii]MCS3567735.1 hypothetical protein [Bradyrhizobium elkanii]MCS3590782.1 hypothetical protein [Bradyrhizobium elkanii]MCS3620225.1 hypothetical protein [Bradyrhizobium elkanii]
MDDGKTFYVVERYINNDLFYWSSGARGKCSRDDWVPKIDDAVKFFDDSSAIKALIYACAGEGRIASHRLAVPTGERA